MKYLSKEEQGLILDFYFRCGEQKDIERGCDLIAANPEAARFYAGLEQTLTGLDNLEYDPCPDNLVDLTISRLKTVANGPKPAFSRLKELLEEQQSSKSESPKSRPDTGQLRQSRSFFIRPLFELLAAAASIVLVVGMFFPGVGAIRAHGQKVACAYNLGKIGDGFNQFYQDHQGSESDMRVKAGSPWWKIGDQGPETHSNTRIPFMLIKEGYVDGKAFVCKGNQQARCFDPKKYSMNEMYDFPSRNYVSYSFMLFCDKSKENLVEHRRRIVASDQNPVFVPVFQNISVEQSFYEKLNEFEKILLNDQLRQMMSRNHRGFGAGGQNVLYCDGSVVYVKTRVINGDDMFTVKGVNEYTGCERPSSENDIFLAP